MGPCLFFKKYLLYEHGPTAKTWRAKVPSSENMAIFSDDLTRLRKLHSRTRTGGLFTPQALVRAILAPHLKALEHNIILVVSAWDDPDRVPHQKLAEQKKRDASATSSIATGEDGGESKEIAVRYPPGTIMTHSGLLLPGADTHVQIDLQRLASSRHMRRTYLEYLRDHLVAHHSVLFPDGAGFVLDHFASGPILFTKRGYQVLANLRHPFGEADMMSLFWCRVLRHMDLYINTIDGDLCLLLLNYARHHEVPNNIWYRWEKQVTKKSKAKHAKEGVIKKKVDGYVDIKEMLAAIGSRLFTFTVGTVMCKTDFHAKSSLISGIGDPTVFAWCMQPHPPLSSLGDDSHDCKWDFSGLLRDVDNLWTYPLASTRVMPTYRRLSAETKGAHPTREQLLLKEEALDKTTAVLERELQRALVSLQIFSKKTGSSGLSYTRKGAQSLGYNLQYWLVDLSAIAYQLCSRASLLRMTSAADGDRRKAIEAGPSFAVVIL